MLRDYDGTHVYALNPISGEIIWHNSDTGNYFEKEECGISVQGHLFIEDDKLCFNGGTTCRKAEFDLKTGKNINDKTKMKAMAVNRTVLDQYFSKYNVNPKRDILFEDGTALKNLGHKSMLYYIKNGKNRRWASVLQSFL